MSGFCYENLVLLGREMVLSFSFAVLMMNLEIMGIQISRLFFFFVFCIILIHKGGTLMGINTLKIAVGETDCQVQKRNEVTWSRVYCMGSVVLVLNFYQRVQTRPKPSDFSGRKKILSTPSFGREVKPFVPCRRFTACYVEVGHFQAKFIGQFSPK